MTSFIFMDNYRGFSNTLIELKKVNILVGENSTGKSSFLSILNLLSGPRFLASQAFQVKDEYDLGDFQDIVSASSKDRSYFRVGYFHVNKNKNLIDAKIFKFKNGNGHPKICNYLTIHDGKLLSVSFSDKAMSVREYNFLDFDYANESSEYLLSFVNCLISHVGRPVSSKVDFDLKGWGGFPLNFIISAFKWKKKANNRGSNKDIIIEPDEFFSAFSSFQKYEEVSALPYDPVWISPIRSEPQKIYDHRSISYSPSGKHTPHLIRKTLRSPSEFATKKIVDFGIQSGLFKTIDVKSYGSKANAPFSIIIEHSETKHNIVNVGYGVSQVLPLIFEMTQRVSGCVFSIQQPEVHLHPKAQSAFGSLVHTMASEMDHIFCVETHSDYIVNRFRISQKQAHDSKKVEAQILFFCKQHGNNSVSPIKIDNDGKLPNNIPSEYVDFFIQEQIEMLGI